MTQASAEKLEHTGPAKKKKVASMPQRESSWQVRQTRPSQKGKEQSRLSRAPDRKKGIQCHRSKENSSKGKKKRRVFLCRRTVRVKVKSKVILTSFPKSQGRETFVGAKDQIKEERLVELVGGQNPGSKAPPWSKIGQERKEQRRCQGRSECQSSDEEELVGQSH